MLDGGIWCSPSSHVTLDLYLYKVWKMKKTQCFVAFARKQAGTRVPPAERISLPKIKDKA